MTIRDVNEMIPLCASAISLACTRSRISSYYLGTRQRNKNSKLCNDYINIVRNVKEILYNAVPLNELKEKTPMY